MGRPQASKVVHLCVSVGADDAKTLDEFEAQLKSMARHPSRGGGDGRLVTVVGATYVHDGKTYRKPDWEAWDGDEATKPRAMFDHSGGPAVVERVVPTHAQKSPAEALAGIKRTPKRVRKVDPVVVIAGEEFVDAPRPRHTKRTGNDRKNDAINDREVTDIEGVDDDWGSW